MMARMRPKIVLTIAGSDPTGGAGIQGDLRALTALEVHALSVITSITVQGTRGVRSVHALDAALVRAQIDRLLDDVAVDAVKTGALVTAAIANEVAAAMEARPTLPLVVDPVIASSSGAALLDRGGVLVMRERLLARATVITPNLFELRALLDDPHEARDAEAMARAGERLRARGARAVLAKGGHLAGDPVDVLIDADGVVFLPSTRIDSPCTHGTGCTLSSAIAAHLANGAPLRRAVAEAQAFVVAAIREATPIGEGKSPLDPMRARAGVGCAP